jgi:hypothetical protein
MRHFMVAAVFLPVVTMFTAGSAHAQCPVNLAGNPLGALTGTWGFKLQGFVSSTDVVGVGVGANGAINDATRLPSIALPITINRFVAIIGTFTATNGTTARSPIVPLGTLTLNVTVNLDGQLTTGPANGSFTVNGDCSGGTLDLGLGYTGLDRFQFIFINGSTELYLVNADSRFSVIGEAKKAP